MPKPTGHFRDILGLQSVDAGHGWLIFGLPPAEAAFHPADRNGAHALYFMSNDLKAEMTSLSDKGVECAAVQEERSGLLTHVQLPAVARSASINLSIRRR